MNDMPLLDSCAHQAPDCLNMGNSGFVLEHVWETPQNQMDYLHFPHQTCYLRVYPICNLWLIRKTIGFNSKMV